MREVEFYNIQSKLWKKETEKHPKNAAAWQNYYLATRYSNYLSKGNDNSLQYKTMDEIISTMEKQVPNTIEYYNCKLLNYNTPKDTPETFRLIQKAMSINPNDPDILEDYINYCEINGQTEKLKGLYQGLNNSKVIDFGIMEFNYNMLMSVDKNAILFTNGDNDTYPARILQEVKGIRPDITIINISLGTYFPLFAKRLLKQKNIEISDEFLSRPSKGERITFRQYIKELTLEISKKYPTVPLFFAITSDTQNLFEDSLYCTGLAYKYSPVRIDNISRLKNNIENRFHLDYLKNGMHENNGLAKEIVDNCNMNYVSPFAMLYKHYRDMGENNERTLFYREYILDYARKMGNENEMKEYLAN